MLRAQCSAFNSTFTSLDIRHGSLALRNSYATSPARRLRPKSGFRSGSATAKNLSAELTKDLRQRGGAARWRRTAAEPIHAESVNRQSIVQKQSVLEDAHMPVNRGDSTRSRRAVAQPLIPDTGKRHSRVQTRSSVEAEIAPGDAQKPKKLLHPHVLAGRLKQLCDNGKLDDAVVMLKNAPLDAQNTPVWNTLMWESMKARKFKLSYKLFTDMKRRGFSPTTRTYQTMLAGLSRIENWKTHSAQLENAHSLYASFCRHLQAVLQTGETENDSLDITPISFYIKILGDAQEHQKIFDVYYAMEQSGPLSPNEYIYASMFQATSQRRGPPGSDPALAHQRSAADATLLWRLMLKASQRPPGFPIDSHIIAAALKALSRGSAAQQDLGISIAHEFLGFTLPDQPARTDTSRLTAHSLSAALELCNHARKHRLCIHFAQQVTNSNLSSLVDRHHMDQLLSAYVSLSSADSDRSRNRQYSQEALKSLQWMLRQEFAGVNGTKIRPGLSTYKMVLMACWHGNDWPAALVTFELMTGYKAKDFSYARRADSVRPLYRKEHRSTGRNLMPDAETMSCMVRTATASGDHNNMRQCLRMVEEVGAEELFALERTQTGGEVGSHALFYPKKLGQAIIECVDLLFADGDARKRQDDEGWRKLALIARQIVWKADNVTKQSAVKNGGAKETKGARDVRHELSRIQETSMRSSTPTDDISQQYTIPLL